MSSSRIAVVILAAGSGRRVGAATNKVLLPLAGRAALAWSVRTALALDDVHRIVLVVRAQDRDAVEQVVAPHLGSHDVWQVDGGETRHDSETNALAVLRADIEAGEIDVVAIHDAARPLASPDLWARTIDAAAAYGGALPGIRQHGLLSRGADAGPLEDLFAVQTPQAFRAAPLLAAYDAARRDGFTGTDTSACLERYTDLPVVAVAGEVTNIKVTWAGDVAQAEALLLTRAGR